MSRFRLRDGGPERGPVRRSAGREGGIALLLALLVLVILAVLVGQMTATSLHNRTIAQNHLADLQNTYGTRSAYHRAALFLQADLEQSAETDSLAERWATPFSDQLGRARVEAAVADSERFINLSQLVNDRGELNATVAAQLRRLVRVLRHPPEVAERIIDYIDADSRGDYEARARNERLFNIEELLRVDGIAPEILYGGEIGGEEKKGLLPFLTIWPRAGPQGGGAAAGTVNVNTAPAEVLQALSDEMTPGAAGAIVSWRMQPGPDGRPREFKKVEDLKQVPGLGDTLYASISGQLAVKSQTFEVRTRSSVGNLEKGWVYVVRRTSGQQGGVSLLASQRMSDFLSVRPPEEPQ